MVTKFFSNMASNSKEVIRNPHVLERGTGFFWIVERIFAEWQFSHNEVTPRQLTTLLTNGRIEDVDGVYDSYPLSQDAEYVGHFTEYLLVRVLKPAIVVETGVCAGYSSSALLQALDENGSGELYSIDLPTKQLLGDGLNYSPLEEKETGWAVPTKLRQRWHLILGDARQKLPGLLDDLQVIDIFIHDSLHTEKHMMWEYNSAWPFIRDGGLLLSDNIGVSFVKFLKNIHHPWKCVHSFNHFFGGTRKHEK